MMNPLQTSTDNLSCSQKEKLSCRISNNFVIYRRMALMILSAFGLIGCGKPFEVKPRTTVQPPPSMNYAATVEVNGLTFSGELMKDEDYLYDTFDGNLILAGILPVRVKLQNASTEKVEVKDAKFTLLDATNHAFKIMDGEKAYKQLRKYYAIKIYNKSGNNEAKKDFSSYELDRKKPLNSNEIREGLLFFQVPNYVINTSKFRLLAKKLNRARSDSSLELQLN